MTASATITEVDLSKTFLLSSVSQSTALLSANHFGAVRLTSSTQLVLDTNVACSANTNYSVQVVQLDGVSVSRNTVDLTSEMRDVTGLPNVSVANTWVLSTFRADTVTNTNVCARMVRGEVLSPTALRFTRWADSNSCGNPRLTIAWERIAFSSGAQVQTRQMEINAGATMATATLSAVDLSRSLVLTSSQAHGGQGSGETSLIDSPPNPSSAAGRLWLRSTTQLDLTRDINLGKAKWTAYVIQFDP